MISRRVEFHDPYVQVAPTKVIIIPISKGESRGYIDPGKDLFSHQFAYFTTMVSPLSIRHSTTSAARCMRLVLWLAGAYGFINHLERDRDGVPSPDGRRRLSIDCSTIPYKVMLEDWNDRLERTRHRGPHGKEQVLVANAGSGPNLSGGSQFPTILTYWLNNQQFLYTVHHHRRFVQRTGYEDVAFHRLDLSTRRDTILDELDSLREGPINDRFVTDSVGNLLYQTTAFVQYRVDRDSLRLRPYPYFELGHGFAIGNDFDTAFGQVIRYNSQEVGRLWCTDERVANGLFAAAYGPVGSNLGYPKGIQVWSAVTRNWIIIDIPRYCQIIGWAEE